MTRIEIESEEAKKQVRESFLNKENNGIRRIEPAEKHNGVPTIVEYAIKNVIEKDGRMWVDI